MASTPDPPGAAGGYRNAPTSAPASPGAPGGSPSVDFSIDGVVVVDASQLRRAAAGFQAVADDARAAVQNALNRAEGGTSGTAPWGSDPLGKAFESQYLPVAQPFADAVNALPELFDGIADRLAAAAKTFTAADEKVVELASSLTRKS
jgi:hypothetical protein